MFLSVVEFPGSHGACHNIEVIQIIAMNGGTGVIALWHHGDVAIFHRHGLIEFPVIGIDALEGKTLGRIQAVVIGLLQQ